MTSQKQLAISDESTMMQLGQQLAGLCHAGLVIYFQGELGAGKTTLIRGLLRALGVKETVKSPTYTLVESYELSDWQVHHFDLYRLTTAYELEDIGIRDYIHPTSLVLIEWPEKGMGLLPKPDIYCYIEHTQTGRALKIEGLSAVGEKIVNQIIMT